MVKKVNFVDYFNAKYHTHPNPRLSERFFNYNHYEKFARTYDADFIEVFSTSFFPKTITDFSKNKNYIIWDNHFWDLFQRFLMTVHKIEHEETMPNISYDFFVAIFSLFLTSVFYDIPEMSLAFAMRYASTGFAIPRYCIDDYYDNLLDFYIKDKRLTYAKDFVFFHELMHVSQLHQKSIRKKI